MKNVLSAIAVAIIACASVYSCASSSYSYGRDFDEKQVAKIEKGKTTGAEVKALFGEPFQKSVVSANEEKWIYFRMKGTATAHSVVFSTSVTSEGTNKTLDVLFKDGVVTNFAYSEGPQTGTYGNSVPVTSNAK